MTIPIHDAELVGSGWLPASPNLCYLLDGEGIRHQAPSEMDRLMTPAGCRGFSFAPVSQSEKEQMDNYLELPIGDSAPDIVTAIVETPQDRVNKYEYDLDLKVFVLDRNLHSPIHYPGDYGFVTQTIAQDGDPLDILVLGDGPSFTGCLCKTRPRITRTSVRIFSVRSNTSSLFTKTSKASRRKYLVGRIGTRHVR
jgi:hypothetical protein